MSIKSKNVVAVKTQGFVRKQVIFSLATLLSTFAGISAQAQIQAGSAGLQPLQTSRIAEIEKQYPNVDGLSNNVVQIKRYLSSGQVYSMRLSTTTETSFSRAEIARQTKKYGRPVYSNSPYFQLNFSRLNFWFRNWYLLRRDHWIHGRLPIQRSLYEAIVLPMVSSLFSWKTASYSIWSLEIWRTLERNVMRKWDNPRLQPITMLWIRASLTSDSICASRTLDTKGSSQTVIPLMEMSLPVKHLWVIK